jgi:membrane protease YdiL (CAAX protease family)
MSSRSSPSFSGIPAGLGIVGVPLAVILVNGFGEETGRRGFALPQLQRRYGPVAASAGPDVLAAAMWTFVVVTAVVLLVTERHAHRAGRPTLVGAR